MGIAGGGSRLRWEELPAGIRAAVEHILGDRVTGAVSQPGGFSPGTADRVVTATGRRAFVKAVSPEQNEATPALHRREAAIGAELPSQVPAPRLLGSYDDGHWIVLVLTDVDGRHPRVPWDAEELDAVLGALRRVGATRAPASLPEAAAELAGDFAGWERVREDPPEDLDPWVHDHLEDLVTLAAAGLEGVRGEALLHLDTRADNILLADDGPVIVDWPWACRGARWVDVLALLVNVELTGGHDVDALATRWAPEADEETMTGFLAGLAGMWIDVARTPSPPGLPTVRAFQRAQGESTLAWVRRRLGSR